MAGIASRVTDSGAISNHDSFAARHALTQEHYKAKRAAANAKLDAGVMSRRAAREATDPAYAKRAQAHRRSEAESAREKVKHAESVQKLTGTPAQERSKAVAVQRAYQADNLRRKREILNRRGIKKYSDFVPNVRRVLGKTS